LLGPRADWAWPACRGCAWLDLRSPARPSQAKPGPARPSLGSNQDQETPTKPEQAQAKPCQAQPRCAGPINTRLGCGRVWLGAAWPCWAWLSLACRVLAWNGRGSASHDMARPCLGLGGAWSGLAKPGLAWQCVAWLGWASLGWLGLAWPWLGLPAPGLAQLGLAGLGPAGPGLPGCVQPGPAKPSLAQPGTGQTLAKPSHAARHAQAKPSDLGVAWPGWASRLAGLGWAWLGSALAWLGLVGPSWRGRAWPGLARPGPGWAWLGLAGTAQGEAQARAS